MSELASDIFLQNNNPSCLADLFTLYHLNMIIKNNFDNRGLIKKPYLLLAFSSPILSVLLCKKLLFIFVKKKYSKSFFLPSRLKISMNFTYSQNLVAIAVWAQNLLNAWSLLTWRTINPQDPVCPGVNGKKLPSKGFQN